MPRTAILYARSNRRAYLDRQVRELQEWCDRAGVIPLDTITEVTLGIRVSRRCREILAKVAAGYADLILIRDVTRISENPTQLQQIITQYRHHIAISRDDLHHCR